MTNVSEAAAKILAECERLGLTMQAEFVPFSRSRNASNDPGNKPSARSLNWRITMQRNGREILITDYSAGIGHCPSYKHGARWTLDYTAAITFETEHGYRAAKSSIPRHAIVPDTASVVASLVLDSSVLDAGGFEQWAAEYGYDSDSRSAEATYRLCLDIALKMRAAIGDAGLEALRTACEDY